MTKQSDIEMVAKARAWAVKAHAGQKDKAGKDYEYSEFMSFERSFISHTPRQAKTDHVQMRCVF